METYADNITSMKCKDCGENMQPAFFGYTTLWICYKCKKIEQPHRQGS